MEYRVRSLRDVFEELDSDFYDDDEEDMGVIKDKDKKFSQWLKSGSNQYSAIENSEIMNELPSSFYTVHKDQKGNIYLLSQDVITDEIIEFEDSVHTEIMELITTYWNSKDAYLKYKVAYKLGILLYGSPGCGKTTIIQLIAKYLLKDVKGLIITIGDMTDLYNYSTFIKNNFRKIEPNRHIVVILEDIDAMTDDDEATVLNILDGSQQTDHVVYIATTNYPEKLKERILNRPSRFNKRYEITLPNEKTRETFFKTKLKEDDLSKYSIDIDKWVEDTNGFTMDHIKNLLLSVVVYNNTYEEALNSISDLTDKDEMPDSMNFNKKTRKKKSVGF
jgi:SpoVK/Ycf46/Vps4 family AAA+-type ATPase